MKIIAKSISIDPAIRSGKPCITGTRITVGDVLSFLAGGMTMAEVVTDYPELTEQSIRDVLAFAAKRDEATMVVAGEIAA
jgi:uncharacterized protein (DUF433 family)